MNTLLLSLFLMPALQKDTRTYDRSLFSTLIASKLNSDTHVSFVSSSLTNVLIQLEENYFLLRDRFVKINTRAKTNLDHCSPSQWRVGAVHALAHHPMAHNHYSKVLNKIFRSSEDSLLTTFDSAAGQSTELNDTLLLPLAIFPYYLRSLFSTLCQSNKCLSSPYYSIDQVL